ncbi:MAG TPA: glycyl-radical enzyme activating protein [Anaerolineae bacterium]|nr:glycyl-radical enzyme activating protein [Anaerolineae bacterium]
MPAVDEDRAQREGTIFDVERWSGNDGPGIRTVVFAKGCPLRCVWCCNPESWSPAPQMAFFQERCQDCGQCRAVCQQPTVGHALPPGCTACGRCVAVCPAGARELLGKRVAAADLLPTLQRDRVFYRQSGGGVTFSGGEPLAQPCFLAQVVGRCAAAGLSMALETCGHFSWVAGSEILACMDLIFLDLKHMDPAIHRQLTGASNEVILENAVRMSRAGLPLVVRFPLVPTLNDDDANVAATAAFVARHVAVLGVEVLPYHTLGKAKYQALGLEYRAAHLVPPGAAELARAREIFQEHGLQVLYFGSAP